MARMNVKGLENFSQMIVAMGERGGDVMKAAVYEGADVMTRALKEAIMELPEEEGYLPNGAKRQVITKQEKQAMADHVGIASMDYIGGKVTTAIGFNGYTGHPTKKYPKGTPVALLARSIESGSSVRHKFPFIRTVGKTAKEKVQQAMIEAANQKIQELTKE